MPANARTVSRARAKRQPLPASVRSSVRRHSTVSRWGNSLGVRIPQQAADHLKLTAGAQVTVEIHGDSIMIRPVRKRKKWTEAELLKGVTPEMVGGEIDWGPPVGKEVW